MKCSIELCLSWRQKEEIWVNVLITTDEAQYYFYTFTAMSTHVPSFYNSFMLKLNSEMLIDAINPSMPNIYPSPKATDDKFVIL